jgi:DNA-binding NarL/FixJ family response regulator
VVRIKVLLVDDDSLVRAGLRTILSSAEGLEVVGEADDEARAVAVVRKFRPNVVLMDICRWTASPPLSRAPSRPPPQVIVLTMFQADEQAIARYAPSASGFLVKDLRPADIVNAVRAVASGDAVISPSNTRTLLSHFGNAQAAERRRAAAQQLDVLTERNLMSQP